MAAFAIGELVAIDGLLSDHAETWRKTLVSLAIALTVLPLVALPLSPWLDELERRRGKVINIAIGVGLLVLGIGTLVRSAIG